MSEETIETSKPISITPNKSFLNALKSPASKNARDRERLAWLLVIPVILVVLVIALYPLSRTIQYSFTNARLSNTHETKWVGLLNYTDLIQDPDFRGAVFNTVILSVVSVFFETIFGLIIALVIQSNFRGRGAMRTAILIPWAIPTVVSAQMWTWMYNDVFGVLNDFLVTRTGILSTKIAWIADAHYALGAIIAVDVWKTTPFMALLLLAGLQIIPSDIYEAARVDGASKIQQFWLLTLPLLKPSLLVALIFRTLDALRIFDLPYVMKGIASETVTMAVLARNTMIDNSYLGQGAAMSIVIFIIIALFAGTYIRFVRIEEV